MGTTHTSGRWATTVLVTLVALGACTRSEASRVPGPTVATSPTPTVRVAFVTDLHDAEAAARSAPAFQAASLAFSNAGSGADGLPATVEVTTFDTGGDPDRTAEVARTVAADPSAVAAIAAPGLAAQAVLGDALDEAGLPWLSLSTLGAGLTERGWSGWRRLVVEQRDQAAAMVALAEGQPGASDGFCVAGDGSASSRSLLRPVVRALGDAVLQRVTLTDGQASVALAVSRVSEVGCGVVLWGGEGSLGAALRRQLAEVELGRVGFVGGDQLRDQGYLDAVGPDGEGTLATCPCVDLSLSTDFPAQRFIQDYQSEFGLPPGPYAVEAWDAARMLVTALRQGAIARETLREAVADLSTFDGLAGRYRFDEGGGLVARPMDVHVYVAEGGRWLERLDRT